MAGATRGAALQGDLRAARDEATHDDHAVAATRGPSCSRCGGRGGFVRASRLWWAVLVPVWIVLLFFGACAAVMLPLNVVLVPAWLACATSIGALSRKVTNVSCRDCGVER